MTTISVTRETRKPPVRWETFPWNNVCIIDLCLSNMRMLVQTSQDLLSPVNEKYLTVSGWRDLTLTSACRSPMFSWRVWAILGWCGRVYHTVPLQIPSHIYASHINFRNPSENYDPFKIVVTGQPSSSGKRKEKVKWSPYRPDVAQMVGRGIALLFHDRGTRREWVVSNTPRPHFSPGKDTVPILQEAGWAPGPVWTGGKSRPHRDSIPDRPARSQSLYPLSYRAHSSSGKASEFHRGDS